MFSNDVDLVRLEPGLFDVVGWSSQRLLVATGAITSGVLLLTAPGDAQAAGVQPGDVIQVGGVPMEVLTVAFGDVVLVSRIGEFGATPIVPLDQPSAKVEVTTFRPQIGLVHRQILRSIGIDPDGPLEEGEPGVAAVLNPDGLRLLESLGALHMVFSAAAAISPGGSPLAERAAWYRERFADERSRAVARMDTDGDGRVDATRRPSVVPLVRV